MLRQLQVSTLYRHWSLDSPLKAILNSLVSLVSLVRLVSLVSLVSLVGNTPKMTPANFLNKSLNRLFIDPGVDRIGPG